MKLVFLGAPGAGKGTVALKAAKLLSIQPVSTGNIFRAAVAAESPLGLKVKSIMASGALVDDETTIALIKERLGQDDLKAGYILDGFPRTILQAEALASFSKIDKVVNFEIPDEAIIKRLSGRIVCKKCGFAWHKEYNPPTKESVCDKCGGELYTREDDKIESIKNRLKVYKEQTAPLIDFYRKAGLLVDLDASGSESQVIDNFKALFKV